MADYKYTLVPGKLKELLDKIRQVGIPPKANQQWLSSIGYKSSNDRAMLGVLGQIKFIDESSAPTELWKQYRGANHKAVLAEAIKQGYSKVFEMYPNAYDRTVTELQNFFSSKTQAGTQVVVRTVQTFKALSELAEFKGDTGLEPKPTQEVAPVVQTTPERGVPVPTITGSETGLTINLNIQLTLPETTDETVYDKLFAALKRHLLS